MRRRIVRVAGLAAVSTVLASSALLLTSSAASADTAGGGQEGVLIVGSTDVSGGVGFKFGGQGGTEWQPLHGRHEHRAEPVADQH